MEYFSLKEVEAIKTHYLYLIGQDFYFNWETSVKEKLSFINSVPHNIEDDKFHIVFVSENIQIMPIYDFLTLNKVDYSLILMPND